MPETEDPSTVHGSPGMLGSGATGTHFVALQALPPSFAYGMHFSPTGQSSIHTEHACALPNASSGIKNPGGTPSGNPSSPVDEPAALVDAPAADVDDEFA
ncbi:MAG: hypothetical protein AAGA54_09550 [Myxococcota bacterium]